MDRSDRRSGPVSPEVPLWAALFELLRSPRRLLFLWNWKSALLSLFLRGPIFLVASVHRGWRSSVGAVFTESVFCLLTAGFYGAVVQIVRNAQPEWLTGVFLTLLVPGAFQVFEYWLHRFRGTPHLRPAEIASVAVSGISALFNWYAMRRGTLLVGSEGGSFGTDLRRLPRLIFGFLAILPRQVVARVKGNQPDFAGRSGKGKWL
ncbi:MAG: hypothetical protein J2P13_07750 [Acidobacteria bacterium]|nr:hypothetical protein [Acidobacteriota bacterium]